MNNKILRENVLSAYRKLLKLVNLIKPENKKIEYYNKIKEEFRKKSNLQNDNE